MSISRISKARARLLFAFAAVLAAPSWVRGVLTPVRTSSVARLGARAFAAGAVDDDARFWRAGRWVVSGAWMPADADEDDVALAVRVAARVCFCGERGDDRGVGFFIDVESWRCATATKASEKKAGREEHGSVDGVDFRRRCSVPMGESLGLLAALASGAVQRVGVQQH